MEIKRRYNPDSYPTQSDQYHYLNTGFSAVIFRNGITGKNCLYPKAQTNKTSLSKWQDNKKPDELVIVIKEPA